MRRTRSAGAWLLAGACLCAGADPAAAVSSARRQEHVLGLLALPEVFGRGACDRFTPEEIPLYAMPDTASRIGAIRVDRYWTFHEVGGCEGLTVGVHREGEPAAHPLPTEEFAYEMPGAVVLERRDPWFRVRLAEGAAWVRAPGDDRFQPLERLLMDGLAYLTREWDGRLAAQAGASGVPSGVPSGSEPAVRVAGTRRLRGVLWVQVEVLSHSPCESGDEPTVAGRGWLPAHAASGARAIWFHARGC